MTNLTIYLVLPNCPATILTTHSLKYTNLFGLKDFYQTHLFHIFGVHVLSIPTDITNSLQESGPETLKAEDPYVVKVISFSAVFTSVAQKIQNLNIECHV